MGVNLSNLSHVILFGGVLPIVSFCAAWLFDYCFPKAPFWVETLSPLAAYGILYSLFEKYIWSLRICRLLYIVNVPNLNGRWKGIQKSTHNGGNQTIANLEIIQTFSKISVSSYYTLSESRAVLASFAKVNGETYLFYVYDNEPSPIKQATMQIHKGMVKLRYLCNENKLVGTYFNTIGNQGEMDFQFEGTQLKHHFVP